MCVCICDFFGAMVQLSEHCVPWSVGAVCRYVSVSICICDFFGAMVQFFEHCVPWSVGAVCRYVGVYVYVYVIFLVQWCSSLSTVFSGQ